MLSRRRLKFKPLESPSGGSFLFFACALFPCEQGNFTHAKRKSTTEALCPYGAYAWLLKIFRGFITFNSHYTNNMPVFFATNLHFPAAIAVALVSLYFVAFPSLELAIPCIT